MHSKIKVGHKPDSVRYKNVLIIYLVYTLLYSSSCLPLRIGRVPSSSNIRSIAPRRVYLVSLQPNCTCFLLHLSSVHTGRMLSATILYGVRTFLSDHSER